MHVQCLRVSQSRADAFCCQLSTSGCCPQGECQKNPGFMADACKLSCKLCAMSYNDAMDAL